MENALQKERRNILLHADNGRIQGGFSLLLVTPGGSVYETQAVKLYRALCNSKKKFC
jgi:hypothetical protein